MPSTARPLPQVATRAQGRPATREHRSLRPSIRLNRTNGMGARTLPVANAKATITTAIRPMTACTQYRGSRSAAPPRDHMEVTAMIEASTSVSSAGASGHRRMRSLVRRSHLVRTIASTRRRSGSPAVNGGMVISRPTTASATAMPKPHQRGDSHPGQAPPHPKSQARSKMSVSRLMVTAGPTAATTQRVDSAAALVTAWLTMTRLSA